MVPNFISDRGRSERTRIYYSVSHCEPKHRKCVCVCVCDAEVGVVWGFFVLFGVSFVEYRKLVVLSIRFILQFLHFEFNYVQESNDQTIVAVTRGVRFTYIFLIIIPVN